MNNLGRGITTALMAGGIVMSVGMEANANQFDKAMEATTTVNLNVRPTANTQGAVIKTIKKGTKITVIGFNENKTWAQLKDKTWVSAQYLNFNKATTNSTTQSVNKTTVAMRELTVTATSLNVRTGPGTNYSVAGSLKKGATAMTNIKSGNWYEIDTNRWVHMDYVKETIWSINSNATDKPLDVPASDEDIPSMNAGAKDELLDVAPGDENPIKYVKVSKGSVLNVRYTRALGGSVKDRLPAGKAVYVINEMNGVSYIKYPNSRGELVFGYVASQYLEN